MSKELVEAGLKLASSSQAGSNYATEWLDRTIYQTVFATDSEGKTLVDGAGNKIVLNQALYIAGSFLSKIELNRAEEVEKEFKELNSAFRKQMDDQKIKWRLKKTDQKSLQIVGVTGI